MVPAGETCFQVAWTVTMKSNDGREGLWLRAHPAGEPWSEWRWLEADGSWSSTFYINLEQPWIRTPIGYDSHDWILDIVVRLSPFQAGGKTSTNLNEASRPASSSSPLPTTSKPLAAGLSDPQKPTNGHSTRIGISGFPTTTGLFPRWLHDGVS